MPAHDHPLLGKWRIVEMELWDSDFLDLVELAHISFDAHGRGELAFGAVQANLHCRYGQDRIHFTWQGFDEMDPASGAASLGEDGFVTGEIRSHDGDDSTLGRAGGDLFHGPPDRSPRRLRRASIPSRCRDRAASLRRPFSSITAAS